MAKMFYCGVNAPEPWPGEDCNRVSKSPKTVTSAILAPARGTDTLQVRVSGMKPMRLTGSCWSRTIPRHHRSETRMHPFLRPLGLALLALALVSCNTPPQRQTFPEI